MTDRDVNNLSMVCLSLKDKLDATEFEALISKLKWAIQDGGYRLDESKFVSRCRGELT